ncbi:MAG: hypothetical protein OXU20_23995 [Myxococcales bacterium]|nr:hypothetical protein [Myxococcales bacterium]MDD9970741.1 hypothetical protein [Myxococcales bacterium]
MHASLRDTHQRWVRAGFFVAQSYWLMACGAALGTSTSNEAGGAEAGPGDRTPRPDVAGGATALRTDDCSAPDGTCNARDEDCDGIIDEGCGYGTGAVQITLAWDSGADLDLYVTDPSGQTIFFNRNHRTSDAGGELDHDSRGNCRPEQQHQRVENAFWRTPAPGQYQVEVHYFSPCGGSGSARATLSIAVGGKLVGAYEYDLDPEERVSAARFSVPN